MAGQARFPGEPGLGWTGKARAPHQARKAQALTLNPPQVGFFPSECVELFTERPSPGLKGGKCQGQSGEAFLHPLSAVHPSHPSFTPQMPMVSHVVSQLPRVSPL